jgi:F-type H+-transporting ATPase subunit a
MTGIFNVAYAAETAEHSGISIHLAPTIVGHFFGVPITNTLLTVWLVMAFLFVFAFFVRRNVQLIPGKLQVACEEAVGGVFNYISEVLESKELAKKFFPLIMTIFIFILAINWVGLLPGVTSIGLYETHEGVETFVPLLYPAGTDLNITIAFAIIAFFTIEIAGVLLLGVFKYAGKFINFKSPLGFLIGIIELLSELARLVSFSFRLFGNIFAGKTLILVALFFVPLIVPVPLLAFEIFVGFIQAFIFAILTLFFIKLAIEAPH